MTERSARAEATTERADDGDAPDRIFASAAAVRKGRFLALLLLVNWGVMGVYVLSQGVRSLVGGLAFVLGLFALVGGLAYLRASRNAVGVPLIELDEERVRHRRFASTEWSTLALADVEAIAERTRDALTVRTREGDRQEIPWLAVSDPDRERLVDRIERSARP